MNKSRVIVSLDFPDAKQAIEFCHKIDPIHCKIKIGKELFTAEGPKLIEKLRALDFEIFLDLKYHDIPNTVANLNVTPLHESNILFSISILYLPYS